MIYVGTICLWAHLWINCLSIKQKLLILPISRLVVCVMWYAVILFNKTNFLWQIVQPSCQRYCLGAIERKLGWMFAVLWERLTVTGRSLFVSLPGWRGHRGLRGLRKDKGYCESQHQEFLSRDNHEEINQTLKAKLIFFKTVHFFSKRFCLFDKSLSEAWKVPRIVSLFWHLLSRLLNNVKQNVFDKWNSFFFCVSPHSQTNWKQNIPESCHI